MSVARRRTMADQAAALPRAQIRAGSASSARLRSAIGFYVAASILALFFFGPFYWTVSSSLKAPSEITTSPPVFVPAVLHFENYLRAWTKVPFLTFYVNS